MAETKPLVREWRDRLGFTQRDAAALLGYSKSRFCVYDRGEETPHREMLLAMKSIALGQDPYSIEDAA
jgi:transcriptional regulator with XRE-family HTH domain